MSYARQLGSLALATMFAATSVSMAPSIWSRYAAMR